ncbi:MAG TPA: HAD hydrolase-like protein [Bryobacteraceae bacterium]|nr:HAD hydrolase-like protein [Bryobacteraceae bacterium]
MMTRRQSMGLLAWAGALAPALRAAGKIRLIVFDVGGTIIQDRGDVPEAFIGAFAKRGMTVTPEEIAKWRGAAKREVVRRFAAERSKAKGAELDKLVAAIYADFNARTIEAYRAVPPITGAEAAFEKLRARGILLTASTGFGHEIAASIFQRLGWEKYFVTVVTGDDVKDGRPAPYMIFRAMEAAKVTSVAEVMAVGDTPLDLQAGANAGARAVVGVLSGASKRERLEPEPHTDIIASVAELPELVASKY